VKKDIINYTKKVKIGGLIAGHDFNQPDVKKAVKDILVIFKTGQCIDRYNKGKTMDWWTWK
jgi:hypothetical protein